MFVNLYVDIQVELPLSGFRWPGMEWHVQYQPLTSDLPWAVFTLEDGRKIGKKLFETEEEARYFISKKEKRLDHPAAGKKKKPDHVEEASIESFPASDPPAWTGTVIKKTDDNPEKK